MPEEPFNLVVLAPAGPVALAVLGRCATLGFGVRLLPVEAIGARPRPDTHAVILPFEGEPSATIARIEAIRQAWPGIPVVLWGRAPSPRVLRDLLHAGAADFCFDDDPDAQIVATLERPARPPAGVPTEQITSVPIPSTPDDEPTRPIGPDVRAALTALAGKRADALVQRHGLVPLPARSGAPAAHQVVHLPSSARELPVVDARIPELQALMERPVCELREVEAFVTSDPSLVVAIIKASNSAYYRSPKLVTNLRDACVRLGNRQVFALLLEMLLQRAFVSGSPEARRVMAAMWKNATLTARLSRKLAEWTGLGRPEDVYVAGLLHNLGEIVLVWRVCEAGGPVTERLEQEAERISSGHESTGRYVAERWGLPPLVQQLNAHHHQPRPGGRPGEERLRLAVLGAWGVSRQLLGDYLPNLPPTDPTACFDQMELSEAVRARLADECASALAGL